MTGTLIPFGPSAGIETAPLADSWPKGSNMTTTRTARIRELNDDFRTTLLGGKTFLSPAVSALGPALSAKALAAVRAFTAFTADHDPYGEHDCGFLSIGEEKLCWKIDYYDPSLELGSRDPADPAQTTRVLTIMLAEEA